MRRSVKQWHLYQRLPQSREEDLAGWRVELLATVTAQVIGAVRFAGFVAFELAF